jgi:hypothetical protein
MGTPQSQTFRKLFSRGVPISRGVALIGSPLDAAPAPADSYLMLKLTAAALSDLEKHYPGIQAQIASMEDTPSGPCPDCGRVDAARIIIGSTGRTLALAAASSRCHLLPNGTDETQGMAWFCHPCQKAFA